MISFAAVHPVTSYSLNSTDFFYAFTETSINASCYKVLLFFSDSKDVPNESRVTVHCRTLSSNVFFDAENFKSIGERERLEILHMFEISWRLSAETLLLQPHCIQVEA